MKPYPSYKDSGLGWIGEIPIDWKVKPLKYICEYNQNSLGNNTESNYELNYLEISDVDSFGNIQEPTHFQFSKSPSRCRRIVQQNDTIISTVRTYLKSIGFIENEVSDLICSTGFCVLSPNDEVVSKFIFYLVRSKWFVSEVISKSEGISYPAIQPEKLVSIKVVLPDLSKQKKIVSFLDHKTQKIDELIKKTEKKIELLKEIRLALVDNVIMDSNIQKIRLNHLVDNICRPIRRKNKNVYCPLGLYNRGRGIFHKQETEGEELGDSTFYFVKENDLIISGQFAWEGAVALAGPKEEGCVVSHRFPIVRGKEGVLLTEYLWAFLTSERGHFILNESSIGSAGRNRPLNINRLMKEKIPVPSIETQEKVSKIVKIERNLEFPSKKFIRLMKEYRQSLISEVVTGKIDVRDEVVV